MVKEFPENLVGLGTTEFWQYVVLTVSFTYILDMIFIENSPDKPWEIAEAMTEEEIQKVIAQLQAKVEAKKAV